MASSTTPHCVSAAKSITVIISIAPRATWNWIRLRARSRAVLVLQQTIWMSCIVCVVTTKWAFRFAVPAVVRLKSVWSPHWANTGMSSISFAPNVRNHFWAIATTRNVDSPIAKPIIINCSATCASVVIKLSAVMVSHWQLVGIRIYSTWCDLKHITYYIIFIHIYSVHRLEQSLVCPSFRLLGVRPEAQSKIQILRIRWETSVQKMLWTFPQRIAASSQNITWEYHEETILSRGWPFHNLSTWIPLCVHETGGFSISLIILSKS